MGDRDGWTCPHTPTCFAPCTPPEVFRCETCGTTAHREDGDYPWAWRLVRRDGRLLAWCPEHTADADR